MQTRSATKRIGAGSGPTDDTVPQKDAIIRPLPGNSTSRSKPTKTPRSKDLAAPKRRRRGKPVELPQLNLDVLFLIAEYIHPVDLLNLARTCKSLGQLLMDPSSTFVWKTARRQAKGLPDCPADLTEAEYTNLMFCARCHGCGKYTTTIFWNIRRRYCPNCRIRQLRRLSSCAVVIRTNKAVLPTEYIEVKKEYNTWCDRDQVASFMHEYRQAPDKKQFISDKQDQYHAIRQHVKKCEGWQKQRELERKDRQKMRRQDREKRIIERLEQHGYQREITYVGYSRIIQYRPFDFKTCNGLTDNEWNQIWPEWLKIMNRIRSQRIDNVVFRPRLHLLTSKYIKYVTQPALDAPMLDLLPHLTDLACFPPFRDILKSPEGTKMDDELFAPAFAELPVLVANWRERLDTELAELVHIPPQLSSENVPDCQVPAPSRTTDGKLPTDSDKLDLACALFLSGHSGVFSRFEVFSVSQPRDIHISGEDDLERCGSIWDRFGIKLLEEAPYIVHACGLDPNVAKADDIDRRNARLRCLCCHDEYNIVVDWRNAMRHARSFHASTLGLPHLSISPRWQLVDDKHIDAIQAVEQSIERNVVSDALRCLLCRPRVGDALRRHDGLADHLYDYHNLIVDRNDLKQGVHYVAIGVHDSGSTAVEMVEERGKITFRASQRC